MQSGRAKQKNWYVVYTCPNKEKKICHELGRRNITAFLPTMQVVRQWSDRKKSIEVPLFPNYLFVNIPPGERWVVLMVSGVVNFVVYNGIPAVVKDTEIDLVKKIILERTEISTGHCCITGEKVRVKHGPLAGLVGRVIGQKGMLRLYVELETIHQSISIDIDASFLTSIE